eukprot:gene13655-10420_t
MLTVAHPFEGMNAAPVAKNVTRTIVGGLTGRKIRLPDVNSGYPKCFLGRGEWAAGNKKWGDAIAV